MSADGRYVVFTSREALVPEDQNGVRDVYLVDRATGRHELIAVDDTGRAGSSRSDYGHITADGRYVFFWSHSSLDVRRLNSPGPMYVRDRYLGRTEFVAGATSQALAISSDGRFVVYLNVTTARRPYYVLDRNLGEIQEITVDEQGREFDFLDQTWLKISDDGRYVGFAVSDQAWLGQRGSHVFRRDMVLNRLERVDVPETGPPTPRASIKPWMSADGRFISFVSWDEGLYPGLPLPREPFANYVKDMETGQILSATPPILAKQNAMVYSPSLSPSGRYVAVTAHPCDIVGLPEPCANPRAGYYVYDLWTRSLTPFALPKGEARLVVSGVSIPPMAWSGNDDYIAFISDADLVPEAPWPEPDAYIYSFCGSSRP